MSRTGFGARGLRFGVGLLSVSRGLGPTQGLAPRDEPPDEVAIRGSSRHTVIHPHAPRPPAPRRVSRSPKKRC